MRKFGRFVLGLLFIVSFLVFLLAGPIKFKVLSARTWKRILAKTEIYDDLPVKIGEFISQRIKPEEVERLKLAKEAGELSEEKTEEAEKLLMVGEAFVKVEQKLKEGKMEEIVGLNIERILKFLKSRQESLILYLPLEELGIPEEVLSEPPFSALNGEVDLEEFLSQSSNEETTVKTIASLEKLQRIVRIVNLGYIGLGLLLGLLLVGYFFLGKGIVKKIRGVSWLLLISGGLGTGTVMLVDKALVKIISNISQMPEMFQAVVSSLMVESIAIMKLIDGVALGLGVTGVGVMIYMVKSGKLKVEKEELSEEEKKKKRKKRWIVMSIMAAVLGFLVFKGVSKVKQKMESARTGGIEKIEEEVYESKYGWRIKVPGGWGKSENEKHKMEMLVVIGKQPGDDGWTYVAIEPFARVEEVDKGGFLKKFELFFIGEQAEKRFPNSKLTAVSRESEWKEYKSYQYLFDHDFKKDIRLRQLRRYIFLKDGGDGWLLYSQAKVEDWEQLKPIILETMESFEEM